MAARKKFHHLFKADLHNLFLSLLINFSGCHRLFHLTKNHVQMLIECLNICDKQWVK